MHKSLGMYVFMYRKKSYCVMGRSDVLLASLSINKQYLENPSQNSHSLYIHHL